MNNFISEKALFSERKIIENPIVQKELERFQKARFDRKLLEYQLSRGVNAKVKNFNSVEEIIKEEDFQPIVFHLEKSQYKDTFDTTPFKKERPKPQTPRNENNYSNSGKMPVLSFEFNITRAKVEKIEIYADDDPYLFAEEFSSKFSKNNKIFNFI